MEWGWIAVASMVLGALLIFFSQYQSKQNEPKKTEPAKKTKNEKETTENTPAAPKKNKQEKEEKKAKKQHLDSLRVGGLKGFSEDVTCGGFTSDGQFLIGASRDRTLRFVKTSDLNSSNPRIGRINLPFDYATSFCVTTDGHHILVTTADTNKVIAYRLLSKAGEDGKTYKEVHRFDCELRLMKSIDVSTNSKFLVITSDDPDLIFCTLKGQVIEKIHTSLVKHNRVRFSPDSKFFALTSWTSDVKIWEIVYNRAGDFEKIKQAMILSGHNASISDVDFTSDSSKAITCSKDGTWKLWKINVNYQMNASPECLLTVHSPDSRAFTFIRVSSDSKTVAVAQDDTVYIYSIDGKLIDTIEDEHSNIVGIDFSHDCKLLATCGEHGIKVWRNPNA